jgi:hypothetical protein
MADGAPRRLPHQLVEMHVLRRGRRLRTTGQLDQVGHQAGELVELGHHVGEERLTVPLREPLGAGQNLDVGPQRGERGPELVGGVGHQLALGPQRRVQRGHHRVEARPEAGDLVVSFDLDALGQVAGLGDVLGRLGQAPHRPQ